METVVNSEYTPYIMAGGAAVVVLLALFLLLSLRGRRRAVEKAKRESYSDMSLALAEGFSAVLRGDAEPERVVEDLQGELEDIIRTGEDV